MSEVKIANPAPLGLSGFALTTLVLSFFNAKLLPGSSDVLVVLSLALFYGGLAQLLAGMWEFRSGNTFGATAFSSYGAFWLSFAVLFLPNLGAPGKSIFEVASASALGLYLISWAVVTGILMLASFRTTGAVALVFILLFITYLLLGIGTYSGSASLGQIGGYVGILTAIAAWYAALAGVLSGASNGKINLPVIPLQ